MHKGLIHESFFVEDTDFKYKSSMFGSNEIGLI